MKREIFCKVSTREKRQLLKKSQTESEELLWGALRNRQLNNLKFRRQYGIGEYIADFYCAEKNIVIEIDGTHHFSEDGKDYDKQRELFMQSLGLHTLRFTNTEVLNNLNNVCEIILNYTEKL